MERECALRQTNKHDDLNIRKHTHTTHTLLVVLVLRRELLPRTMMASIASRLLIRVHWLEH